MKNDLKKYKIHTGQNPYCKLEYKALACKLNKKNILFEVIEIIKKVKDFPFVYEAYKLIAYLVLGINKFSENEKNILVDFIKQYKRKFSCKDFNVYNNIILKLVSDDVFFFDYLLLENKRYKTLNDKQKQTFITYSKSLFENIKRRFDTKNKKFNCSTFYYDEIKSRSYHATVKVKYKEFSLTKKVESIIEDVLPIVKINLIKDVYIKNIEEIMRSDNITAKMSLMISDIFKIKGYCIEPDFKLTNKKYEKDQIVSVYKNNSVEKITHNFIIANLFLELGIKIAIKQNKNRIIEFIKEYIKLNYGEILRLEQKRNLLLKTKKFNNKILDKIYIEILNNNIKLNNVINFIVSIMSNNNYIKQQDFSILENICYELNFNKTYLLKILRSKDVKIKGYNNFFALKEQKSIQNNKQLKNVQSLTSDVIKETEEKNFSGSKCNLSDQKTDILNEKEKDKLNILMRKKNIDEDVLEKFLKDNRMSLSYIKNVKRQIIEDITKQKLNINFLRINLEDVFGLKKSYVDSTLLINRNINDDILKIFLDNNKISLNYIKNVKDKIIEDIKEKKLNINFLRNNIVEAFDLEKNYIDNISLSDLFNRLKEIQKDCFYFKYFENQTLEEIGLKYGLTRERVRQILVKSEDKIFNNSFLFVNKLILSIEDVIRIQQIITKEKLYEQFKDYSNDRRDIVSFINCFLKNKKYEQYDNFIISEDISIKKIKEFLETCSVELEEDIYKKLEFNFNITSNNIEKIFKILNKFILKNGYFVNPTIPNKLLYLFYVEQRPIHISELVILYKREFNMEYSVRNLHVHVQKMQELVLCGRGTYTLKTKIDSKILEDKEYLNKVINLLEDKNYELNVNVIKQETNTIYSVSELILLLNSNDNFSNLGRGYYGLKKWNYNNRKYIKDIIYEYMCENMRPVSIGELLIYLEKQGKILNEYSLNGLLIQNEDMFKKHSFKKWELREYPSISLNLDENKLNTIKNDTKEIHNLLSEIFVDEKAINIDSQQENTNNIDDFVKIIIEKNSWTKQELINIIKDKSVMISSVIDEINEWSNEQYGDFLLEEENSIYILNEDVRNLIINKD